MQKLTLLKEILNSLFTPYTLHFELLVTSRPQFFHIGYLHSTVPSPTPLNFPLHNKSNKYCPTSCHLLLSKVKVPCQLLLLHNDMVSLIEVPSRNNIKYPQAEDIYHAYLYAISRASYTICQALKNLNEFLRSGIIINRNSSSPSLTTTRAEHHQQFWTFK